jgi:uncharacterized protein YutE (UPF0331/DUF86 family)
VDREVVEEKLESLRRCIHRVSEKCPADVETLSNDLDLQDILALNLSRAVQICVDIGAHLLAGLEVPPPDTMGQAFDVLAQAGVIPDALGKKLKKSVGFRNVAVHNYEAIDWAIVHAIALHHLDDFSEFARIIAAKLKAQEA